MTRARLIEVAIVEWFEQDGWSYQPETGEVVCAPDILSAAEAVIDLTALAAHLDVEWDRLSASAS